MPPTQEPFVDHIITDEIHTETPEKDLVLFEPGSNDYLLFGQPGIESIPNEEFMDLISSSAIAYDLSTIFDNLMPPTEYGSLSPFISTAEPGAISNYEFVQPSYFDATGYELTDFFTDVEVPNPNLPGVLRVTNDPFFQNAPRSGRISTSFSPLSTFGSAASVMSASTSGSYLTARSYFSNPSSIDYAISADGQRKLGTISELLLEERNSSLPLRPLAKLSNEYHSHLRDKGLLPPPDTEINWSGKGQHVEFSTTEEVPLQVLSHLGSSISATVDKVQCKRIILARKMMRCTRNWKATDALREVEHLHKLRHFHIVQLVGSYLQGRTFSILMYPAADCHMGAFLEDTADRFETPDFIPRRQFLVSSLRCLASAVAFIHENTTKHMDIKPANILVRKLDKERLYFLGDPGWRVYLTDFGLSTSFAPQDHSQTDRPTARTAKYCAPEVYDYESHGRSADIFSLGCVFLEILSVVCEKTPHEFADFRSLDNEGDESFRGSLNRLPQWVDSELRAYSWYLVRFLSFEPTMVDIFGLFDETLRMIRHDPKMRPNAEHICDFFSINPAVGYEFASRPCCSSGPESYVAA